MRDLEQGTVLFSRYKIIDLIGSGGFSKVYLSENIRTGSLVAVKVVPKNDHHVDLIAEKDLLKELRHSSIPIIVDICEDRERLYLIEEYVEGTPLSSLKLQLDEAEIRDIMVQICDVLIYLHTSFEEPIIYRDLKPDNIIRMNNGRIKLIDFGIAVKHSQMRDKPMVHYGTRGYAAPEQLSYNRSDQRTDLYSMGVSIYYMLTGRNLSHPPYRLQPIREVNPDITPELGAIITKCVEMLPAKRYQNAEQVIHDIRSIGKVQEDNLAFRAFRDRSDLLVTCVGVRRGMGTTHMAFLTAIYHAMQHRKVALIEWQSRDDLIKTSSLYDYIEEKRYHFSFQGIDCYFHMNGCDYGRVLGDRYDVLVVDAGSFEEMEMGGGHELTDELMLICGSKDWEIDYFEEVAFMDSEGKARYLFNFATEEGFARIKKDMAGTAVYQLPYNPNPYVPADAMMTVLASIFNDIKPAGKSVRKGVLDSAKILFEEWRRTFEKA